MVVRIRDLMAAEEELDAAQERLRDFLGDERQWYASEHLTQDRRKVLTFDAGHFQKHEQLRGDIAAAENRLRALQRAFGQGGDV